MGVQSTAQDVEKAAREFKFTTRMVNEYEERKKESMREFRLYRVWGLVVGVGLISQPLPTAQPQRWPAGNRGHA